MYKLKQKLPKEFKIKVNPQQSEALQKHCVSIGIKSLDISDKVEYVNYPYVYRRSTNTYLSADNESAYHKNKFKKDVLPRIKFKDYFEKVEIYTNKEFPNFSNLLNFEFHEKSKENDVLPLEIKILQTENDKLKHKILMLTEKLETIKKVIE